MAKEGAQIDAQSLASVLVQAKMRLDDAVAYLRSPESRTLRVSPALADNNSTCNTACTCGAAREQIQSPVR
jgi:hypothetical protein